MRGSADTPLIKFYRPLDLSTRFGKTCPLGFLIKQALDDLNAIEVAAAGIFESSDKKIGGTVAPSGALCKSPPIGTPLQ